MSVKVIQVGVGGFGTSWRHALTTTPGVEIAALVDINRDALKEAAEFLKVPAERCILSPDAEWTDVEADVVIDATPQLHHYANAMKAFASDKHLIVVKPMSDEWKKGLAMVTEAEERGKKMVVAQQLRFHPVIMKIREIVQSRTLGEVGYIHLDAFFDMQGFKGSYPQKYPLLVQGSIHHFDYVRWVLNQDAVSVMADCWNPRWIDGEGSRCAYAIFGMPRGCRVCYRAIATRANHTNWTCNWRIEGEKGLLEVINDHIYLNGTEIHTAWPDGKEISDLNLPVLNKIIFEKFIRYMEFGDEPGFSGRKNLNSLEMAFGAIESSETGEVYDMES